MKQKAGRRKPKESPEISTEASPPTPTARLSLWPWTFVAVVASLLLFICLYAVGRYAPDASQFQVEFVNIHHPPLPDYVSPDFLGEVQKIGEFPAVLDTRELDLLPKLSAAFARHPWVEQVERVTKAAPQRIQITLRFREPVAVVELTGRPYFVDRHGVYLPDGSQSRELASRLIKITGVSSAPKGPPGSVWSAPGVEAAARLAAFVNNDRENLGFVAIEVRSHGLQPDLRLRTKGGSEVIWQMLSEGEQSHQPSPEEKLHGLRDYCRQLQSLDKPDGGPWEFSFDLRQSKGPIRSRKK